MAQIQAGGHVLRCRLSSLPAALTLVDLLRNGAAALILIGIAYACSYDRGAVRPRVILSALACQLAIGAFSLFVPFGARVLAAAAQGVNGLTHYGNSGIGFVFGGLVSPRMAELFPTGGYVFALRVLPMIIFISALISVLYYLGIMRWVITIIGFVFEKLIGVSRMESFCAVTTVFLGYSEMPAVVRPFFSRLPPHVVFAMMASGMAAVSGSALVGYAGLGVRIDYLIAACFMAVPGGLLFGKILHPTPRDFGDTDEAIDVWMPDPQHDAHSLIEAISSGAMIGLRIAVMVGTMLIAFIGMIALLDGIVGLIGSWFGHPDLTLEYIVGVLLSPLAWLLGVSWDQSPLAASFFGRKIILNEFVAYSALAPYIIHPAGLVAAGQPVLDAKAQLIVTFALCGFANIASVAVLIGSFGALDGSRKNLIVRFGPRAVLAGGLSNLMSANIASIFFTLSAGAIAAH